MSNWYRNIQNSLDGVLNEASTSDIIKLQYLPDPLAKLWRNASLTMHISGLDNMKEEAKKMKASWRWQKWRIVDETMKKVIFTEGDLEESATMDNIKTDIVQVLKMPYDLQSKIATHYRFSTSDDLRHKILDEIETNLGRLTAQMSPAAGHFHSLRSNGIVYVDLETGEISYMLDQPEAVGDSFEDGTQNCMVLARADKN